MARNTGVVLAAVAFLVRVGLAAEYYPFRGLTDPTGQLEALAQECKENPTPELLTTTGWLFQVYRNDNQKAGELFEKALDSQPENPWARYGLCVIDEIEGDFEGVLSNSVALCESCCGHPTALLALLNLRSLFGQVGHFNARVETALKTLLEEKRSGSIQFDEICREILSAISRSRGDAEELKKLIGERGFIRDWRVVGPFGEFGNLSFLSKWRPESDLAVRSRYKIGDGVVKPKHYWSEYGGLCPRWVKRGVYYAEAFVRSRSSQEVVLRVSSACAVELFLNNHGIYEKDSIRRYRPVTEYVKARLSPGYNRLVLKFLAGSRSFPTGMSYKGIRSRCVVSESTGCPAVQVFRYPYGAAAFSVSASRHRWRRTKRVEHSDYEPSALRYFSELLEENPDDPLALGICGILRSVQGDVQLAKRGLLGAVRHVPSYSYFNYVVGVVMENDPSLPVQVRQSEAAARFRSALKAPGSFPLALYNTALLDIGQGRELDAIGKLNECIAQSPGFFAWHETLYSLYIRRGWRNEERDQLGRILGLGIESCAPYHLAEQYYRRTRQHDKLAEVIEKLQRTHVYPQFLARYYSESGRDAKAIAEYRRVKAFRPQNEGIRRSLIELYQRNGRWVEAQRELKDAIRLFPENLSFWKKLAMLKGYTGHRRAERRIWERVLRREPVDRDARKAFRAYGREDILDQFEISAWPFVQDETIRKKYAGVSSAMIIDQAVEEIYPNGSSRQKTHQLILLNDKKAIDAWGEVGLAAEEVLELRTIKRDGTVVEPERPPASKATISMGGLQVGDFIELEYITTTSVSDNDRHRYLGQRFFFQSVELPLEVSQYVVIVPAKMKLQYEQVNFTQRPSVSRRSGKKIYRWEVRDVPAIPREPLAAPNTEFLPFVRVGFNYDEDGEILGYQDHDVAVTRITDEVREATGKVLANCGDDVESRAKAIYSFVNREVRGGGGSAYLSRSASETLSDRRGDRISLAKAMLDAAGVESVMLVARGELSHASKVFPGSFTSALLGIKDAKGRYLRFLDFSSRYLPFGYVNSALQGGAAIPLQDFSSSDFGLSQRGRKLYRGLFTLARFPIADNCGRRTLNAVIGEDGSIEGTEVQQYNGDGGASLRAGLMAAEAYQIRDLIERMANVSFRAAALTHHKVENLADPEKPLTIEYGFRAPNFARVVGKEMLLDQWLPLLRLGSGFAALEARKSPLQVSRELNTRFEAVLKLPAGAKVTSLPSPLDLEADFGFYRLRVAEGDNSIHVNRNFHLRAQRISPQDYPGFVDFCRAVDAAERKEVRIHLRP